LPPAYRATYGKREEDDFSEGQPGNYAEAADAGSHVIRLDPDDANVLWTSLIKSWA